MTGVVAQENQARRLLRAMHGYGAWLASEPGAAELPEAVIAYRWLTERYQPTVAAIPHDLHTRLSEPEFYVQVMEHLWYLSEEAGHDYGLVQATNHYIENVLKDLPEEATLLVADEAELSSAQSGLSI